MGSRFVWFGVVSRQALVRWRNASGATQRVCLDSYHFDRQEPENPRIYSGLDRSHPPKPQRPNPAVSDQSLMPSARIDSIAVPVRVIVRLLPLSLTLGRIVRYTSAIGASRLSWKSPRAALFSLCSIYFDFITAFDSCGIRGQNFSASSCRPHCCG